MKSHDYAVLCGPIMMYALDGLMDQPQLDAISMLFEGLGRLWAKTIKQSELPALRQLLNRALAHCSLYFPVSQHDLIVHLLHHVLDSITLFGPPWAIAMWSSKQLWGTLVSQNHSNPHPATSVMGNIRALKLSANVKEKLSLTEEEGDTQVSLSAYCHCICRKSLYQLA